MSTDPVSTETFNVQRLTADLEFLTELAQVIASNTELQPILDWITQKTTGMLRADEGSIRLLGPEAAPSLKTLVRKESPGITSGSWPPAIGMNVMGFLMVKGKPGNSSPSPLRVTAGCRYVLLVSSSPSRTLSAALGYSCSSRRARSSSNRCAVFTSVA